MNLARAIALLGVAAMAAALYHGFSAGDFFEEGARLTAMPWGIVSLVDLYTGFTLFSCWIFYREKSPLVAGVWTAAMMGLGFFAGSVYALLALQASRGDWRRFWLGARA